MIILSSLFLKGTLNGYLKFNENLFLINMIIILESISKILLILLFQSKISLSLVLIFIGLPSVIINISLIVYFLLKEYSKGKIKVGFQNTFLFTLRLSSKVFAGSFLKLGFKNFDNIILSSYLGNVEVGIYQSILKLLSPISLLSTPLNTLYHSKVIKLYDKSKEELKNFIFNKTPKIILIGLILLIILRLILPKYLLLNDIDDLNYPYSSMFWFLSILSILPLISWWGGSCIICYDPNIPIYTNSLASFLNIILPILFLTFIDTSVLFFVISLMIARIFTWPIILINFNKYLKYS